MSLIRLFGNNMLRDPFFERTLETLWPEETTRGQKGDVEKNVWQPRCDVSESAKDIKICASLPGVKKEDINLEIDEDGKFMTITGKTERKEEKDEKDKEGRQYHYVERMCGDFRRSFQLPHNVDTKSINAHYEDGVLDVTIPKKEQEAKTKRIEIGCGQKMSTGIEGNMSSKHTGTQNKHAGQATPQGQVHMGKAGSVQQQRASQPMEQ